VQPPDDRRVRHGHAAAPPRRSRRARSGDPRPAAAGRHAAAAAHEHRRARQPRQDEQRAGAARRERPPRAGARAAQGGRLRGEDDADGVPGRPVRARVRGGPHALGAEHNVDQHQGRHRTVRDVGGGAPAGRRRRRVGAPLRVRRDPLLPLGGRVRPHAREPHPPALVEVRPAHSPVAAASAVLGQRVGRRSVRARHGGLRGRLLATAPLVRAVRAQRVRAPKPDLPGPRVLGPVREDGAEGEAEGGRRSGDAAQGGPAERSVGLPRPPPAPGRQEEGEQGVLRSDQGGGGGP